MHKMKQQDELMIEEIQGIIKFLKSEEAILYQYSQGYE